MALNTQVSHTAANAMANALAALCNSGTLNLYSGTQPTDANTALSGNTLLAALTFGATAFATASNGVVTANAITSATAAATGTATFFRVLQSNGTTVVWDGTVGTSGCNLNINSTAIQSGANVSVTALTYTATENNSGS